MEQGSLKRFLQGFHITRPTLGFKYEGALVIGTEFQGICSYSYTKTTGGNNLFLGMKTPIGTWSLLHRAEIEA